MIAVPVSEARRCGLRVQPRLTPIAPNRAVPSYMLSEGAYVASTWANTAQDRTNDTTNLGGVHAASPRPTDRCDHQRPGIGDAEFFPRCIAAGCSPKNTKTLTIFFKILFIWSKKKPFYKQAYLLFI